MHKPDTPDFILKVLGVYTHSMETIYPSLCAQVAVGTFFMKYPVYISIQDCKGLRHFNTVPVPARDVR